MVAPHLRRFVYQHVAAALAILHRNDCQVSLPIVDLDDKRSPSLELLAGADC
jgi:hypothetical protein